MSSSCPNLPHIVKKNEEWNTFVSSACDKVLLCSSSWPEACYVGDLLSDFWGISTHYFL